MTKLPYIQIANTSDVTRLLRALETTKLRVHNKRYIADLGVRDVADYPDGYQGYWYLYGYMDGRGHWHYEIAHCDGNDGNMRIRKCISTNSINHFISCCRAVVSPNAQ